MVAKREVASDLATFAVIK